jgi:hypothetical protein
LLSHPLSFCECIKLEKEEGRREKEEGRRKNIKRGGVGNAGYLPPAQAGTK